MQAYSLDLRERIIRCWEAGQAKPRIAQVFMVSLSTVKRYIKRFKRVGHVRPTQQRRTQGKLTKRLQKQLLRQVAKYADYTLGQHAERWNKRHHVQVSCSCLSRTIRHMGITRKKKTLGAVERDEAARAVFREMMAQLNSEGVVVVDESGSRIGMVPLYARAARGLRVYDRIIRNYGQNVTLLASMTLKGIQAAMTIEGAVDKPVFEAFVEKVLVPTLQPGQMVMMDNLSSHKTKHVEQLIISAGCQLIFFPAYSPDISPIEEAFSKLKAFMRRCSCKTLRTLTRAIGRGLNEITPNDAAGWFVHAGFSVEGQPA
jgi:transposase